MAKNRKQLELLLQGVNDWNHWRQEEPDAKINLRYADLSNVNLHSVNLNDANLSYIRFISSNLRNANFRNANLRNANLRNADLSDVNLDSADLRGVYLNDANLRGANLRGANLRGAFLIKANLSGANLSYADLRSAKISDASFCGANLVNACLVDANLCNAIFYKTNLCKVDFSRAKVLNTNLSQATLTQACIEDWNINSSTNLSDIVCDYVYLKQNQQERRPSNGSFKPGEFALLVQKTLETVDLIFVDGIDWQAFFQSFQQLRSQYEDISIQAIEKKSSDAFVIRLEVPPEADKAAIESHAKELYEMKLQLQEQRYQAELQAKDGQISLYQEQLEFHRQNNTNLMEIVKTMAEKENQPTHQTIINAQTIGATHSGSGDITNFTQNINSNINDITTLIDALRNTAQTFPDEQRQEALEHLGDVEEGIRQPNQVKPHRVKAALAALLAISGMVAATTDFSNNVLEIGNKLGIELIQPHSK